VQLGRRRAGEGSGCAGRGPAHPPIPPCMFYGVADARAEAGGPLLVAVLFADGFANGQCPAPERALEETNLENQAEGAPPAAGRARCCGSPGSGTALCGAWFEEGHAYSTPCWRLCGL
jgi:hypothetical protein